jgi:hypothetical protein
MMKRWFAMVFSMAAISLFAGCPGPERPDGGKPDSSVEADASVEPDASVETDAGKDAGTTDAGNDAGTGPVDPQIATLRNCAARKVPHEVVDGKWLVDTFELIDALETCYGGPLPQELLVKVLKGWIDGVTPEKSLIPAPQD